MDEQDRIPLVEAYPVEDQYAEGLGRVEVTGHNVRFVFYSGRPKDGGEYDREVVARVVVPMEGVVPMLEQIVSTNSILGKIDLVRLWNALVGMTAAITSIH